MKVVKGKRSIKFTIKVQPKASMGEVAGIQGDHLKIRVTAPPSRGEANRECVKILARWLGVSTCQVEIESGDRSRIKKIKLTGDPDLLLKNFREKVQEI